LVAAAPVKRETIMDAFLTLRMARIARVARFVLVALMLAASAAAIAGPPEEANAAIDRWSAAYTANAVDAVVNSYWPDAILLGTVSPVISVGADAIRSYFTALKLQGSGNKNVIQERHTMVLDDNAVLVTGFYEFTRMKDGQPVLAPSRFTMLVTRRNGEWRIAHHHSSPHVQANK
jgi:uncharacterized protein (TIGR02246 family)